MWQTIAQVTQELVASGNLLHPSRLHGSQPVSKQHRSSAISSHITLNILPKKKLTVYGGCLTLNKISETKIYMVVLISNLTMTT